MFKNEACLSDSSSRSSVLSSNESGLMLVDITDMPLQHSTKIVADVDGSTEDCTIE
jgi:hypothetical protein